MFTGDFLLGRGRGGRGQRDDREIAIMDCNRTSNHHGNFVFGDFVKNEVLCKLKPAVSFGTVG